jgi:uncharacterized protein with GYD domain
MAQYLLQLSYTPAAWGALLKKPQDRSAAVSGAIKKLGGSIQGFWMAFGEHDVIGLVDMPDNVSAAAFAMAVAAGGACTNVKTTPLLNLEDAKTAMKKASTCGYKPATKK